MDLLSVNDPSGELPISYYTASANEISTYSSLNANESCDVCVIGGGLTGLSAAINLRKKGFSVILLEARRLGFGASGRNGGQVGVGQRRDQFYLEKKFGLDQALCLRKKYSFEFFTNGNCLVRVHPIKDKLKMNNKSKNHQVL